MALRKSQQSLKKWTGQNWGTRSGKPSILGPKATGERYLPEDERNRMSKEEYASTTAAKRKSIKKGKQYSKQPNKKKKSKPPTKKRKTTKKRKA